MISGHELRRRLTVYRPDPVDDGAGGQELQYVPVGTVDVQVSQASAAERVAAAQAGALLTHVIYARPDADVVRGDELRDATDTFRVVATVAPSDPTYLRIDAQRVQAEPGGEGS